VHLKELDRQDPRLATLRHRGGLQLTEIRPESPAGQGGLRKDDILFGLDRYATLELKDIVRILDYPRVDGPTLLLQFHVLREGKQAEGELKVPTNPF
jgi:S1-C subfamily serine protease